MRPGVKLTDTSWPTDELPARFNSTSTVNTAPERTSEGAFTIEYEGTAGVAVGIAVGVAVGDAVGEAVGVGVGGNGVSSQ
jgi:hypothetical protein